MTISINEAIELEIFKDFNIVAGKKGLDNEITRIGILDYEKDELIEKNFRVGEFAISTLIAIKDDIEGLYALVEKLISVGVSGLAIKNIYFDSVPDNVVELANKRCFPIMIFSDVFFEDIITGVADAVKGKNENEAVSIKIDNILYNNLDNVIIKRIAYEINSNFKEKNISAYCKRKDGRSRIPSVNYAETKGNKLGNSMIPYKDGLLFINTFEGTESLNPSDVIFNRLETLGISPKEYRIGVSTVYSKLGELNFSIKECLYAFRHSAIYNKDFFMFKDIGINKVLLPLIDNPWVIKYHDEMIEPLIMHDNKYETELLKTAIVYIENNGDIKATACELFQHGNTIRYRIDKISKILGKNINNINDHFYEELAMAIRIYNILNIPL